MKMTRKEYQKKIQELMKEYEKVLMDYPLTLKEYDCKEDEETIVFVTNHFFGLREDREVTVCSQSLRIKNHILMFLYKKGNRHERKQTTNSVHWNK